MDNNHSLDLSDVLSRIHKQAQLVGGPHDGKRAPLPPLIYDHEHPRYLCQPGRLNDQTWYHYQLDRDTVYVYADHCNTLTGFPHNPGDIENEQERSIPERWLFAASILVVLTASAMTVGYALAKFFQFIAE